MFLLFPDSGLRSLRLIGRNDGEKESLVYPALKQENRCSDTVFS
jgi:hypothetical protein